MASSAELETLCREHYPYVRRLAFSLVGDGALADDVTQDTFLAVVRGIESFRGDADIRTWLYRITVRIAGRLLARRRRLPAASLDADALAASSRIEGQVEFVELVRALRRLPLAARSVLALSAIEGLSHQEIADVLGIPVGTVGSRLHNARRVLLRRLSPPAATD